MLVFSGMGDLHEKIEADHVVILEEIVKHTTTNPIVAWFQWGDL